MFSWLYKRSDYVLTLWFFFFPKRKKNKYREEMFCVHKEILHYTFLLEGGSSIDSHQMNITLFFWFVFFFSPRKTFPLFFFNINSHRYLGVSNLDSELMHIFIFLFCEFYFFFFFFFAFFLPHF